MSLVKIQPYITDNTANFTFGGLNISANAVFGNANLGNLATANYLTVNSNILAGNVGNSTTYFYGNGYNLTGIIATTAASLVSGNSNVRLVANGNASISITGTSNVVIVTSTGVNVAGYLNATNLVGEAGNISNVQAANISGTVANANYSTYAGTVVNSSQSNITSLGLLTSLSVNGYSSFIGNANVVGNVNVTGNIISGNASLGNLASATYIAGTLTTQAQPNITSVGTLTGLTVTGDTTLNGNFTVSGSFEYANVTSFRVKDTIIEQGGNTAGGALTTNDGFDRGQLLHYYSGGAVDAFMGWKNSSQEFIFGSNVSLSGEVVTVNTYGNIHAGYIIGNGSQLTGLTSLTVANSNYANYAGNVVNSSQPNITSVGTLTSLSVTGNITSGNANLGNLTISNYFSGSGNLLSNIQGANVSGTVSSATTAGTVTTAAQPNITSVGTLTNTTMGSSNSLSGGNLVSASYLTGTLTTAAQPNITSVGTLTSLIVGNSTANTTFGNATIVLSAAGNANLGNLVTTNNLSITTYVTSNIIPNANVTYSLGNSTNRWKDLWLSSSTIYFATDSTISSGTLTSGNSNISIPTSNGNVTISAIGNANIVVITGTGVNIAGTLNTGSGAITTTGNANVGNLGFGSGIVTGTGNITGGNIIGIIAAGSNTITTTGNIIGGNANLGNVANANFFSGSGQYLTSVTAVTAGTVTTAAQPNITSLGTLTTVTIGNSTNNTVMSASSITSNVNVALTGNTINLGPIANIKISGGTAGYFITTDGAGNLSWGAASGGGGVSASGTNTQVQFNDNGVLGAVANLAFNKLTNVLTVDRIVNVNGANLGSNVSNVYIGGGSANQILKTDGSGNLSWIAQPVATITVDNFTGDGTTVAYTLSVTPTSINQTLVNYNGIFQLRTSAYTISGSTITFTEAPLNNSKIEVTTTLGAISGAGAFVTRSYSGTGAQTTYTVTSGCTVNSVIVTENGLVQTPTTDYTISGTTLTFVTAPANGIVIQIRELAIAVATATSSPITIQNQGSNITTSTSLINFTGSGVTSTNSSGNVTVTIPGGSGGVSNARVTGYNLVFGG
jgi:hypothetical protein